MDKITMEPLTILVVDDDRISTAILSNMLKPFADNILIASDGVEGLQLFKTYRPEIVLSDINMPRMGGLEMVEEIRKLDESVKIAIFTNFENRNILLKAIQYGVNQFFSKPFEAKLFTQVLQHLCADVMEKRRISSELKRQQNILQAINQMAYNFLQQPDWTRALHQEMLRLKNAAGTSAIFIYKNEEKGDTLVAEQLFSINDNPDAKARKKIHYRKHNLMRWKKSLEQGFAVNGGIKNYDHSKQKLLSAFQIECLLILPIFVNQEWWGFLGIGSNHGQPLNPSDVEMLSTIASIIGSSINNKRNIQSLEMSAAVFEHTMDGVLVTDANNRIMHVNDAFIEITGYQPSDVIGKDPKLLMSGTHNKHFYSQMWEGISTQGHWQGEVTNRKKDGEMYIEWLSINAIKDDQGNIENFIGIFSDVTHHRKDAHNHAYLATHDPLTGLSNRLLLNDRLEHAINHAERFDKHISLIFCDLDDFKPINDTYGHSTGDEILKRVGNFLKETLRKEDTICRFGGDEFVILLEDLNSFDYLDEILQRINAITQRPCIIDGNTITIGMSIGASIYPDDGMNPEVLINAADSAMYRAKNNGKNRIAYSQLNPNTYSLKKSKNVKNNYIDYTT